MPPTDPAHRTAAAIIERVEELFDNPKDWSVTEEKLAELIDEVASLPELLELEKAIRGWPGTPRYILDWLATLDAARRKRDG